MFSHRELVSRAMARVSRRQGGTTGTRHRGVQRGNSRGQMELTKARVLHEHLHSEASGHVCQEVLVRIPLVVNKEDTCENKKPKEGNRITMERRRRISEGGSGV